MEKNETVGFLQKKPHEQTFRNFLWNSEKKEFCGRTGISWAKIGGFYMIYYSCLALFFAGLMAVFYTTLDTENSPKYSYGESILKNPVLIFRPLPPRETFLSTLIRYNSSDVQTTKQLAQELDKFVANYTVEGALICSFDDSSKNLTETEKSTPCQVRDTFSIREKNGILCNSMDQWGYAKKSPCIILKLNKMIGWQPDCYRNLTEIPTNMPEQLKDHIKTKADKDGNIPPVAWVSCEAKYLTDAESSLTVRMHPYWGFPAYYFPCSKNPLYRSPLVAVEISNLQARNSTSLECKVWAKNVKHDRQFHLGMMKVEILVD